MFLEIIEFDTESCCDHLYIYDGDSAKAPLIASLSGAYTESPGRFNSSQRFMYIRFRSDDTITGRGFVATYTTSSPGMLYANPLETYHR